MAKPTHAEIAAALKVLIAMNEDDTNVYERLESEIPANMRPPRSDKWGAEILVTGVDADSPTPAVEKKIFEAMVSNWEPFTVKAGRYSYTVAPSGRAAEW